MAKFKLSRSAGIGNPSGYITERADDHGSDRRLRPQGRARGPEGLNLKSRLRADFIHFISGVIMYLGPAAKKRDSGRDFGGSTGTNYRDTTWIVAVPTGSTSKEQLSKIKND